MQQFGFFAGDYMNSKEYRKPDWVTKMEEIQKRLSGKISHVHQSPMFKLRFR